MTELKFFVTGHKGFETVHFHELRDILVETDAKISKRYGGVEITGGLESVYRVCLYSRTSNRAFYELANFSAPDEEQLYKTVYQVDWSEHMKPENSFAVSATLSRSNLDHSHYASLKVKDAIVDWFRDKSGKRPPIDRREPDLRIHINIHQNRASLSLDLSGESLHRRGYRLQHAGAPLKEHLAASMIASAGWDRKTAISHLFCDPMCGSGTFVIEAAMIAANIPPGLDRAAFGFNKWLKHDHELWQACLHKAESEIDTAAKPMIVAGDRDANAIKIARENAARAGVEDLIQFNCCDFEQLGIDPGRRPAIVITNPPYGERLQSEKGLAALYTSLGKFLTQFDSGKFFVISANSGLLHRLRLNRVVNKKVKNGPLDCVFAGFELNPGDAAKKSQAPTKIAHSDDSNLPLVNRLNKNRKHLQRWARRNGIGCYRIYDADLPEFAFALDVYQSDISADIRWYHLQEYQAPKTIAPEVAEKRIQLAKEAVRQVFEIDDSLLFCKTRRRQRGNRQYQRQDNQGELFQVREGDASLLVNLSDYLDSGLFLDHRTTRDRVRRMASGKSLLNLFCYTGSVGVQAMLGGAERVVNVDMSANYLEWAKENHSINGFEEGEHLVFVRANILELLQFPSRFDIDRKFDIIFLDPPSFSNSSRMQESLDIQRDHEPLITDAMKLLDNKGIMLFSTNRRGFKLDNNLTVKFRVTDISRDTIPEDFKRRPHIHQCWEIRHHATG